MRGLASTLAVAPTQEQDAEHLLDAPPENTTTELTSKLVWPGRTLLFNVKPQPVWAGATLQLNNIDMVLLTSDQTMSEQELKLDAARYLACGELKGGIDPAGADEHWKTARSAFERIRMQFTNVGAQSPQLFFVGAVIVTKMASELFDWLERGELSNAANLTHATQLAGLADWLIAL